MSLCRLAGVVLLACAVPALKAVETENQIDGTVDFVRSAANGGLELELVSETNRVWVDLGDAGGNSPILFSRIRITGGTPVANEAGASKFAISGLEQIQFLSGSTRPLAANVAALRGLGAAGQHFECVACLKGLVLGASRDGRTFAFQDDTGVMLLEMQPQGTLVTSGQEIALEGNCVLEGERAVLRNAPVVDNNDIHTMTKKSGTIFLSAGKHPLRLSWFNWVVPYGLEVYYEGPDLPAKRIPDTALFRRQTRPDDSVEWVPGLGYQCYEGNWLRVPDFDRLIPVKQGTVTNFDTSVITRPDDVGLQFNGYIEVPRDGIYTFSTISDDGSLMFIDEKPPKTQIIGTNALPEPVSIAVRQNLRADEDDRWSQIQGTVTFVSEQAGELEMELSSDTERMHVDVADSSGCSPQLLLNSRLRITGICLETRTTEGEMIAGRLLAPGANQIELLDVPEERWIAHPIISLSSLMATNVASGSESIVHVRGKIHSLSDGSFILDDGTATAPVTMSQPPVEDSPIEMLGKWSRVNSNIVLQCAIYRETGNKKAGLSALPVLATVEQIKRLSREDCQRGYPVKIRGVITTVLDSGFFIQDSSGSIYARWQAPTANYVPRVRDYWEIEGTTFAEFAPNIHVSRAARLGAGTLPEPLHPTWDQLINGSLDTEYVEIQGIVTAVDSDEVTLLTRGGKISLELPDVQPQELPQYENALVRARGCVIPVRDIHTQQVVPGRMRLSNASLTVDEPEPADPFAIPLKHASDLLLFDLRAGAFERVKIKGQIVHIRDDQLFLMDGSDGLRIVPKSTAGLYVGDFVEVVGFSDLGGPSPTLREALVHRINNGPLPDPVPLPPDPPLARRYDATLVCIRARLSAVSRDQSDQILALQAGTRGFVARLQTVNGLLPVLQPDSLLELTGVYAGQGSDLTSGRQIDSFELLLNSPSDVRILAHPSWWTVRHALTVLGGMTFFILAAVVWIALLHRQVEERSNQLAVEIRRHEHTERQRELGEERARIARDLHDDLGAMLTQIRFLSAVESHDAQLPDKTRGRLKQVSEKSHEIIATLDEIVWAVNPANDTLPILANYLSHFAEEFFQSTPIRCRLDVDDSLPPVPLTSEVRHHLYLAVREALNNIAKHSQAAEAWLRIHWQPPGNLCLTVEDNGRGFASPSAMPGNGLVNMRQRMEIIGGQFESKTNPGAGTVCRFVLAVVATAPPKQAG